jgi:LmbE family N-acetylglucosaminyl deacetylase
MAHQDDFEFTAGGIFTHLRRKCGADVELKILATTRGASGHHEMQLEETFRRREREAENSAALIGAEYECLTQLDGSHVPGQLYIDRNTMGGLWNNIRDFEPDFIFCPPVTSDPLAGIHIDHYNTAWAVRLLAYQLTVPHAYPTVNGAVKAKIIDPVIINVEDSYAEEADFDFFIELDDELYENKVRMALCHESQVFEWLPWNFNDYGKNIDEAEFRKSFRQRHSDLNQRYGRDNSIPREYFRITRWGRTANDIEKILI